MQFTFSETEIRVTMPDWAALSAAITRAFAAGDGFALATINLDHMVKLSQDLAFSKAYQAHDLVVADGRPVVWLSRIAGQPVELLAGSDLVIPLAQLAAQAGVPVALVGSSAEALRDAADVLTAQAPGLKVPLCYAPARGVDPEGAEAAEILGRIAQLGPCLCFVALGAPKQECLAARGRALAPQAGFASIGAGLDFLGGHQTRAPLWVRKIAMEWVWRALTSPRRMVPRYAKCLAILPGQIWAAYRQRE